MIEYTSRIGSRTLSNIAALGSAAGIYVAFYPTLITGGPYYLFWTDEFSCYVQNSKLYFEADPKMGDNGRWSTPISVNTFYRFLLIYNFTGSDSANPTFYLNGATPTVTEESTPADVNSHSASIFYFGNYTHVAGSNAYGFQGYISECAIYSSVASADRTLISKINLKGDAARYPNCLHYWDCNVVHDGVAITQFSSPLVPNADDIYTWETAGPAWSALDADDANTIKCTKNDDGEVAVFSLTTTTIPAGADIVSITVRLKGNSEDGDGFNIELWINGAWTSPISSGDLPSSSGYTSYIYFDNPTPYAWTQATIDDLKIRLTPPASIGKDSELTLVYIEVVPFYMQPRIRDSIAGNHIVTSGALAKSEFFMSYR